MLLVVVKSSKSQIEIIAKSSQHAGKNVHLNTLF